MGKVYVKLANNVVVQRQPNFAQGFEEAPADVVCGMILNDAGSFSAPQKSNSQLIFGITREAERRISVGITVNDTPFKCDDISIGRLFNMLQRAEYVESNGGHWSQTFMTSAGVEVTLNSFEQVRSLYQATVSYAGDILDKSAFLQQNPVQNYNEDFNWPSVPAVSF